ncbi:ergothioneine biosynthesis protein EgtB [Sphingosinicella soli]|uniref:Ergothioneine biosynthesis protein EgtB n=1 Tax=Sphingosinicella soli TaxID=333708 RepID=A0A7W7B1M0_9SPHN|nr:ergothioneine biosynthesis protein EgtB [Sphingosinicella soli]MBB4632368.1 ergothioneine biosynthesis protein EgtB [Sphingosinicella soli]
MVLRTVSRHAELRDLLQNTRQRSLALAAPLSDADASVQSMPDASPAKWHLAHTTWFFETFVLTPHVAGYAVFDPAYGYLFNSYYEAAGPRLRRDRRGMLTRPSLAEILAWRAHVDAALDAAIDDLPEAARTLATLGCHHEQQHQELLLTDILHLFSENPLAPAFAPDAPFPPAARDAAHDWAAHPGGIVSIGHGGDGFAFDCETPRHDVLLQPFALGSRLVTNAEWTAFIDDGGYRTPSLWLSDGWAWVQREAVSAPLYRERGDTGWSAMTLAGRQPVDPAAPATHVSYFEADAFARWAGARLPREAEWEAMAESPALSQMFGVCWQWTETAYAAYPRFRPAAGAVGEYNGKFMCGQFVLRGSSCATPPGHSRSSYRNFFYPHQRWQFTGVRLAKDMGTDAS